MLLIENPSIDPARLPEPGITIDGAAVSGYVSIEDIIAAEGERIRAAADSQKTFKMGFIFSRPYLARNQDRWRLY
jgi:hypothetical protein